MTTFISANRNGLLVLAHGSRAAEASNVLAAIVGKIRAKWSFCPVYAASLQFEHPDLEEALETMIRDDIKRIVVVPLFLFPGNHVQTDIPSQLDAIKAWHPDIELVMGRYIGDDDRIVDLVIDRALEGVDQSHELYK